jgi:rod shape-determining protein MreC
MGRFLKNRPLLITIIIVIILIVLISVTAGRGSMTGGESIVGGVMSRIGSVFYDATHAVGDFFAGIFQAGDLDKENADLKERVAQLERELAAYGETRQENERLKQLLNYQNDNADQQVVTARVMTKEPGYWYESFTISAGRDQGVAVGMAVVTGDGLAGVVTDVGGSWCKVMAIIDARCSVSAILERSRLNGVVKGQLQTGQEPVCSMEYLPYNTELVSGDRVITSGLGEMIPKGILIGEVAEAPAAEGAGRSSATVKPAVDFSALEEVMVVLLDGEG